MADLTVKTARRSVGVGPLLVLVALTGCSNGEAATATSSPTTPVIGAPTPADGPTSTASQPSDAAAAESSAVPPTVVDLAAPDPALLLQQALDGAAAGYHFVTTATVGDATALTAEGDRIGAATRLTVTSNGQTVDYIVTVDGTWAGQDEIWQALEQQAPVTDPLAALRTPNALQVTATAGDRVTIDGDFPATALGLPDTEAVTVSIDVVGGALSSLSYVAPGETPRTSVTTVITPITDQTPITAPQV